jgi:hypothetical protein
VWQNGAMLKISPILLVRLALMRVSSRIDRINNGLIGLISPQLIAIRNIARGVVVPIEGFVLYEIGTGLMQIGETAFAICSFSTLGLLLLAKSATLKSWVNIFLGFIGAFALSAVLIVVAVLHKPETETWSNLQKLHIFHKQSTSAGKQPSGESTPKSNPSPQQPAALTKPVVAPNKKPFKTCALPSKSIEAHYPNRDISDNEREYVTKFYETNCKFPLLCPANMPDGTLCSVNGQHNNIHDNYMNDMIEDNNKDTEIHHNHIGSKRNTDSNQKPQDSEKPK